MCLFFPLPTKRSCEICDICKCGNIGSAKFSIFKSVEEAC